MRPGRLNPAPALWAIVYAMVLVLTAFHILLAIGALQP